MARPPEGLKRRQAALLLRCQQLRQTRIGVEVDRSASATEEARLQAEAARSACEVHESEARQLVESGYRQLAGRAVTLLEFQDLRRLEAGEADRQAGLLQASGAALEVLRTKQAEEAATREEGFECARVLHRRGRTVDAVVRRSELQRLKRDEAHSEEADLALRSRGR